MSALHPAAHPGDPEITRLSPTRWQAVADGRVLGHADAARRPDGRTFVSIDSWDDTVFDRLAAAILNDLPAPLHTVVDELEADLRSRWEHAGFTTRRREWEYLIPADPQHIGLGSAAVPAGVTLLPFGAAQQVPLRAAYAAIRAEIEATAGWDTMPAEIIDRPFDCGHFAVAVSDQEYVGLLRTATRRKHARIELLAVRAAHRRRGIARALLAQALDALHRSGIDAVSAFVDETATAAIALFDSLGGARRAGSNLELVLR
ncbi:GNAT family N-acetyltransferase [Nocardia brasiliensis]|uniref:30S ribosomal protein modification n=1 Tax=Nocardia brasiliensis (strain ATCC 700358 / HUJEG-1) TaxID=1133849 RepID=K0EYT8_NOCB7|nr:GNAT family N-acetyltransferase [Nocardia brasiliensis]AFU02050.1 30S ribosomal protein modification [Nocardia brasiliensis ATCC 700358]OCF87732.1 GCN5 family acetyltransferase [Nocardia brasiliensis]